MKEIVKYRALKNLTQTQLANELGMSRGSIAFYESNKCIGIPYNTLEKISNALDTSKINILGINNLVVKPENKEQCEYLIEEIKKYAKEQGFANEDC